VLSAGVAYTVNRILQTNATSGTGAGTSAYVSRPRAGKTGTTDNYVDAWYCGYTPNLSTAVWMGYPGDYDHPMPGVAGSTYCVPMWGKFNKVALADLPSADFEYASMVFKKWNGKYSTMSPSPTESSGKPKPDKTITVRPSASPTATITTKPSPTPTQTKTPKPTPTPTSTGAGAKLLTGFSAGAATDELMTQTDGTGGDGLLGWLVDAVGGLFDF
jgi:penicillin-binding protein 1A